MATIFELKQREILKSNQIHDIIIVKEISFSYFYSILLQVAVALTF